MLRRPFLIVFLAVFAFSFLTLGSVPASAAAPTATSTTTAPSATVLAYRLHLRESPAASAKSLQLLNLRSVLSVLGRNTAGTWLKVQFGSQIGWVRATFVRLTGVKRLLDLPIVS